LRGADLSGANLEDADFQGADLRQSNLQGAHLGGYPNQANFLNAVLEGAIWENGERCKAGSIGSCRQ
jgi:uncharacterized protein YjbI with pentapeptide repeats